MTFTSLEMEPIAHAAFMATVAHAESLGNAGREWSTLDDAQRAHHVAQAFEALKFGPDAPSESGKLFIAVTRAISSAVAMSRGAEKTYADSKVKPASALRPVPVGPFAAKTVDGCIICRDLECTSAGCCPCFCHADEGDAAE